MTPTQTRFVSTIALAALLVQGCQSLPAPAPPVPALAGAMDCLRTGRATTVSAHRAIPGPGFAENSLEAINASISAGIPILEIDIGLNRDGIPFLMHDRTLDRTTTGSGVLSETDLATLRALQLRDRNGRVTGETVPSLSEALVAARGRAVVMLDIKTGVSGDAPDAGARHRRVVEQAAAVVRQHGSSESVAWIAYSAEQSATIQQVVPGAMQSVSSSDAGGLDAYRRSGLPDHAMLAFTGTRTPSPQAWTGFVATGVEVIFGTLGAPGRRLDDVYAVDGDLSEYRDLAAGGATIIATDTPADALAALGPEVHATVSGCLARAGLRVSPLP